jgi:hypothetical protein
MVGKICSDMRRGGVQLEVVLPMWVAKRSRLWGFYLGFFFGFF